MILRFIRHFEEIFACILLVLLCVTVLMQVFSRHILEDPFIWAEELARLLFIWTSFIGAAIALKRNRHFSIDLLTSKMAARSGIWSVTSAWIERVSVAIVILLLLTIIWFGLSYSWTIRGSITEILEISQAWSYLALPVSCIFMVVRSIPMLLKPPVTSTHPAQTNQTGLSSE